MQSMAPSPLDQRQHGASALPLILLKITPVKLMEKELHPRGLLRVWRTGNGIQRFRITRPGMGNALLCLALTNSAVETCT
ncbi:unnamed protein product [Caretta caretta]